MLSYLTQDFQVNNEKISKMIMFTYRLGNYLYYHVNNKFVKGLFYPLYKLLDLFVIQIIAGAEIPAKCKIGEGFWIVHGAKGLIIHPDVKIGKNVRVFHQVTIGANDPRKPEGYGVPVIGDNVLIGAGAKILGPITIGDNARIGANSVVVKSVPPNHTAVGIPATIRANRDY